MRCDKCQRARAQWIAPAAPHGAYCGACRPVATESKIGLIVNGVDQPEKVGLESSDGRKFIIDRELALQMTTVANLMEDAGEDGYVPLPLVDGPTLALVVAFAKSREQVPTAEPPTFSDDQLVNALVAANYLEYDALIDYAVPRVARILMAASKAERGAFRILLARLRNLLPWIVYFMPPINSFDIFMAALPDEPTFDNLRQHAREFRDWLRQGSTVVDMYDRPFIFAARQGATRVIQMMLNEGFIRRNTPAETSQIANDAFQEAAAYGHIAIVELMLKEEGLVDPAENDSAALRYAAADGYSEIVSLLLKDGRVDPNAGKRRGNSAMENAIIYGHLAVVNLLLNAVGIDLDVALYLAARRDDATILQLLLQDGRAVPDHTTIHWAIESRNPENVRLLLADGRAYMDDAVNYAASLESSEEIVRLLLQDERVLENDLTDAIETASSRGHTAVLSMLLRDGRGNPAANHNAAIYEAAAHGHVDAARMLLADRRVNPAGGCNRALNTAAQLNLQPMVQLLLEDGRSDASTIEWYLKTHKTLVAKAKRARMGLAL